MGAPAIILTDWDTKDTIELTVHDLPEPPLKRGGKLRKEVTRYAGTDEVSAQILGRELVAIELSGTLADRRWGIPGHAKQMSRRLLDMWRAEHIVRFEYAEYTWWGLLDVECRDVTPAEIEYTLEFMPLWPKPPEATTVMSFSPPPTDAVEDLQLKLDNAQEVAEDAPDAVAEFAAEVLQGILVAQGKTSQVLGTVAGVANWTELGLEVLGQARAYAVGAVNGLENSLERIRQAVPAQVGGQDLEEVQAAHYQAKTNEACVDAVAAAVALLLRLQEANTPRAMATHTVQEGDTLQAVSLRYYGDATMWLRLAQHNSLTSTDLVAGQQLAIPEL